MKYKTLKGRVVNLRSDEVSAVLQDAGLVVPYEEPVAPQVHEVHWFVGRATSSGEKNISATCSCGLSDVFFFGVKAAPISWHGSTAPPGVITEYRNAS